MSAGRRGPLKTDAMQGKDAVVARRTSQSHTLCFLRLQFSQACTARIRCSGATLVRAICRGGGRSQCREHSVLPQVSQSSTQSGRRMSSRSPTNPGLSWSRRLFRIGGIRWTSEVGEEHEGSGRRKAEGGREGGDHRMAERPCLLCLHEGAAVSRFRKDRVTY